MATEIKIPICLIEKIEFENEDGQFNLLGASVIPESVDFRAFAVNVKTIAPKK